jgi:predicted HicB family RNase H-like nuclease
MISYSAIITLSTTSGNNTMNTMTHKGCAARIEYSDEDHCFIGHIAGINDIVGFHGDSVAQLRTAFEEAVEDYLETCEKLNRPPQKPYSGNLMLRLPPEVHAAIAIAAEVSGKSINQWTTDTLADILQTQSS